MRTVVTTPRDEQEGYLLVALIFAIALILLALSVAAPRVAMELRREREVESVHRANEYVRAIQLYYRKFGHYPASIEQLESSNNIKFLRKRYLDPLTGKPDWRLILVGQNKTKVKGFFGEELSGLGGGLGSAAGMQSPGLSTGPGVTGASGATGGTGSTSATDFKGSAGPFMGVGSSASGVSILEPNEQKDYADWEFLWDPRIDLMKAKASIFGGLPSGSGSSGFSGASGATGSTGSSIGAPVNP